MMRWFVSGTGTAVGKTTVSRALLLAGHERSLACLGLKPVETGVDPLPADAALLADASSHPPRHDSTSFYRERLALSPYAAFLRGRPACPPPEALAESVRTAIRPEHKLVVVEGAGGLLVPLSQTTTVADLAAQLGWPILLVAANRLGVQSSTLCAYESAIRRKLDVRLVVLNLVGGPDDDASHLDNAAVLRDHLPIPVAEFSPATASTPDLRRAGTDLLDILNPSCAT